MPRHQRLGQLMAREVACVKDFTTRMLPQDATDGGASQQDNMVAAVVPVRARVDADQAGEGHLEPCLLAGLAYRRLGQRLPRLAAGIDGLEQPRVEAVQVTLVVDAPGMRTETDSTERRGRQALERGGLVHPGRERVAQRDVVADVRRQSLMAEVADDHPKLEGP